MHLEGLFVLGMIISGIRVLQKGFDSPFGIRIDTIFKFRRKIQIGIIVRSIKPLRGFPIIDEWKSGISSYIICGWTRPNLKNVPMDGVINGTTCLSRGRRNDLLPFLLGQSGDRITGSLRRDAFTFKISGDRVLSGPSDQGKSV